MKYQKRRTPRAFVAIGIESLCLPALLRLHTVPPAPTFPSRGLLARAIRFANRYRSLASLVVSSHPRRAAALSSKTPNPSINTDAVR